MGGLVFGPRVGLELVCFFFVVVFFAAAAVVVLVVALIVVVCVVFFAAQTYNELAPRFSSLPHPSTQSARVTRAPPA
jgi:ABC-type transport system involved in cytochrome bd biosynthesis fused ATPase/permease subunit